MHSRTEHEVIQDLLRSTRPLFASFKKTDYISLALQEAPPETAADRKVAGYISSHLAKIRPTDTIIAEDGEIINANKRTKWIVDPIDGTIPFMAHIPTYMVSIYRLERDIATAAYAYDPTQDLVYHADCDATYCNGKRIAVSQKHSLVEAHVAISAHALNTIPRLYEMLRNAGAYVIPQEGLIFRSMLVANGFIDATIQPTLKRFESGTVALCVTGAGGIVKTVDGVNPRFLQTTENVIIANSHLFEPLQHVMRQALK